MDVRGVIAILVVLTMWSYGSAQNGEAEAANNSTSSEPPAIECLTARNVSGVCAQRSTCDYSTGAIDLTLYAPHAYQRPCALGEVCCPHFAIIHVDRPAPVESDSDEDDD